MQTLPDRTPVFVTTADHALHTAEMVDYFCAEARETCGEIVVGLAPLDLVVTAYPNTKRTAIQLRDDAYCSCNLFAFLTPRSRIAAEFWRRVESQRKKTLGSNCWLWLVQPVTLSDQERPSLGEGLKRKSQRIGLRAGAVFLPFPEAAVNVDTLSDWKLAESIVADRIS